MYEIDWYRNDGRANPVPGTEETIECGVCSVKMNVERNVFGATSRVERMANKSHIHDRFTCPNLKEGWHREIYLLKIEVHMANINGDIDYEEKKNIAKTMIMRILGTHAVDIENHFSSK